ncbi:MAG: GNAT family N-acetyltransferase [Proteobacteria bacterium]|nr:GNAT family N-acetyltransferase [Pseudomonadota bacterium]
MTAIYPSEWERSAKTRDGVSYLVRPIRPDDEDRERRFVIRLSPESRYRRMMNAMKELPAELLRQFVHVDYVNDMAFVALTGEPPNEEIIGVARYAQDRGGSDSEFAVAVADAWQARGVGATLMGLLFEYAHAKGVHRLHGEILADNAKMIELAHWLGMKTSSCLDDQCLVEASRDV